MLLSVISSRTRRKSSPLLLEKAPATFSHIMYFGYSPFVFFLISLTIRTASINRPERAPSSPFCPPATLKSWQGLPKLIMSTAGILPPSISVISPRFSASGKCRFAISMQFASISLIHTVFIPCRSAASGKPAIPSKRLPSVMLSSSLS